MFVFGITESQIGRGQYAWLYRTQTLILPPLSFDLSALFRVI